MYKIVCITNKEETEQHSLIVNENDIDEVLTVIDEARKRGDSFENLIEDLTSRFDCNTTDVYLTYL